MVPEMNDCHDPTQLLPCTWRRKLDALIDERLHAPFDWGGNDCCMWAADCVRAMTGHDPAADLRGTYATAAGALRALDGAGGIEAMGARAGAAIAPLMAALGDIGLIEQAGRDALAVCCGPLWLAPASDGLAAMPLSAARLAWRVNHG